MEKIVHNENLIQYEFVEKLDRVTYNTSVFVVIKNNRVLLIDSGYYKYALEIETDLKKDGLSVDLIIITHYHRDHAEGSVNFNSSKIIASHNYHDNLSACQRLLESGGSIDGLIDKNYKTPDILVKGAYEFLFEGLAIKVIETPGHTPCSLSVIVENKFLYVSDLLLEDIDGKMIIPYIDINSDPKNHLKSLKFFKGLEFDSILFTHGKPKFNLIKTDIDNILNERIHYLEVFIKSNYLADLSTCLSKSIDKYAMIEIHRINQRNAKRNAPKYVSV